MTNHKSMEEAAMDLRSEKFLTELTEILKQKGHEVKTDMGWCNVYLRLVVHGVRSV